MAAQVRRTKTHSASPGMAYIGPTFARTLVIPQTSREVLIDTILEQLKGFDGNGDLLFAVRLAVDEAVVNAITHGHQDDLDHPRAPVKVDCLIHRGSVSVRVTDSGLGFDVGSVPDPTLDENLWNVTGRGIFLMRQSMDQVIYNEAGNSVLLVRELDSTGGGRG